MPTGEETARLLARTEVFADLSERELKEVTQVAVPRSWERNELIFREGDSGETCYLIKSGVVLITREHQDGRMIALAELRAGGMFGELAMFRGETRSATAEAIEATEAIALRHEALAGNLSHRRQHSFVLDAPSPELALDHAGASAGVGVVLSGCSSAAVPAHAR